MLFVFLLSLSVVFSVKTTFLPISHEGLIVNLLLSCDMHPFLICFSSDAVEWLDGMSMVGYMLESHSDTSPSLQLDKTSKFTWHLLFSSLCRFSFFHCISVGKIGNHSLS